MTDEQKAENVDIKADEVNVEQTESASDDTQPVSASTDLSDQTLQGSDVEVDQDLRERQALADADGRKEYTPEEVANQDPRPYDDVRELGDRPAGDQPVVPQADAAAVPQVDEGPTEAEAAAMRAAAEEQAAGVARRQALEAEEASLKAEQKAITERKKAVREALGEAVEDDGDSEGWVK